MELKKLYPPTFSALLIICSVGLLISIAIIRFVEYRQTCDAGTRINAVAKVTSHKLELLDALGKTHDSVQRLTLVDARQIRRAMASTEGNLSSYRNMIRSSREQVIFDELERLNREVNSLNASLLFLQNDQSRGKQIDARYFISRQEYFVEKINCSVEKLSALVGEQAEIEINDIKQKPLRLKNH